MRGILTAAATMAVLWSGAVLAAPDGNALYEQRCAICHDKPTGRTPAKYVLQTYRTPEFVVRTLTKGAMRTQAQGLSAEEIQAVAVALTGKPLGGEADPQANLCTSKAPPVTLAAGDWPGFGRDELNTRFQPQPGFLAGDVKRLAVKWTFALPGGTATGMPVVAAGRVFAPTRAGFLFALDAATGCTRWAADLGAPMKGTVRVGPGPGGELTVFAPDERGTVHALSVATGKELWSVLVDDHPAVRLTGSPQLHDGRLYVPVASSEETAAANPAYECCSFQGKLLALDAKTGKILWSAAILKDPVQQTGTTSAGTRRFGPSGGGVWSTPTIDARRGVLYVGTGDSYTEPRQDSTNAMIAFDLKTGQRRWTRQVIPADIWVYGCDDEQRDAHANCPKRLGPDFDFGSAPILQTLPGGRQILVAGAKSGTVYGFDPDADGKIVWQVRLGRGGAYGGVEWGIATDGQSVFAPISDVLPGSIDKDIGGGLFALGLADGKRRWDQPPYSADCPDHAAGCSRAQPAAPAVMPGAVFAGSWDGHLRAHDNVTGALLWDFNTRRSYPTVNGGTAEGGGIDMGGPVIANGTLFVNSGATFGLAGNALIAFTVDGK